MCVCACTCMWRHTHYMHHAQARYELILQDRQAYARKHIHLYVYIHIYMHRLGTTAYYKTVEHMRVSTYTCMCIYTFTCTGSVRHHTTMSSSNVRAGIRCVKAGTCKKHVYIYVGIYVCMYVYKTYGEDDYGH